MAAKEYIHHIDLYEGSFGDARRLEILNGELSRSSMLPKELHLKDIDEAFKEWITEIRIAYDDGTEFPTIVLFSNQRFSEYAQTWKHTDSNNNMLLNFKSVTRDSNPEHGNIHSHLWNIPGEERFFTMKRKFVLDDNGTESLLILKMRTPTSLDLKYKVSIFTNKYEKLNEMNEKINEKFASRQCYIWPNGHPIPMILESIGDESQYSIDNRQYYSQTYSITAMGYILTEDDFRIDEVPLKLSAEMPFMRVHKRTADVEIYGTEGEPDESGNTPSVIEITFSEKDRSAAFTIDTDFIFDRADYINLREGRISMKVNGDNMAFPPRKGASVREGDRITVSLGTNAKLRDYADSAIILNGFEKKSR